MTNMVSGEVEQLPQFRGNPQAWNVELAKYIEKHLRHHKRDIATLWPGGVSDHALLSNLDFSNAGHTGQLPIANGGTGKATAQLAINALSAVSGATNEHVLTKDTATGNAIFKVAAGGSDSEKVKIDVGATADYIGAANSDGVLRAGTSFSYVDGGNFVTLNAIQGIRTVDSPTFAGQTITGCSVVGLNSAVFQPTVDSTTFFQILDADGGTPIFNVDTVGEFVGIGTGTPDQKLHVVDGGHPNIQVRAAFDTYNDYTATEDVQSTLSLRRSNSDTVGTLNTTVNGQSLGLFGAYGVNSGSSAFVFGGGVRMVQDGAAGATRVPIKIVFYTAPDGTTTPIARLTVRASGRVGINTTAPGGELHIKAVGGENADLIMEDSDGTEYDIGVSKANAGFTISSGGSINSNQIIVFKTGGNIGIGEIAPETLTEWTHAQPYLTLHNSTHEDTDGGRESRINFKGEQSGGEETTLARIQASHNGTGDDEKGKIILSTNAGSDTDTPTTTMSLDSQGLFDVAAPNPVMSLHDTEHTDADSGRVTRLEFRGEKSGGEEHTLALMQVYHEGAGDDYLGYLTIGTNGNDGPTVVLTAITINSSQNVIVRNSIENLKFKITAIGGYAVKLTNKTGGNTVAGQLVKADTATNDAVILAGIGDVECFGVFLDAGIADGSEAWVVVSGIADVALDDNVAAVRGNWMATGVAAGYARTSASPAAAPNHFEEIGHCIETVAAGGGGTHILARCVLHFN